MRDREAIERDLKRLSEAPYWQKPSYEGVLAADVGPLLERLDELTGPDRTCYSDECAEPCQSYQKGLRVEIYELRRQNATISDRLGETRKNLTEVLAERDALRARVDALAAKIEAVEQIVRPVNPAGLIPGDQAKRLDQEKP